MREDSLPVDSRSLCSLSSQLSPVNVQKPRRDELLAPGTPHMKVAGKQIQEKAVLYERVDHGRYFSGGVKVKVHTDIVVPKPLH